MELAGKGRTCEDRFDLILLEQLFTGIPNSEATFIRQCKAKNVAESIEHAQSFVDARPGFHSSGGGNELRNMTRRGVKRHVATTNRESLPIPNPTRSMTKHKQKTTQKRSMSKGR